MNAAAQSLLRSMSVVGIVLAVAFFAGSLTPSLMPRSPLVQGVLSGVSAAVGYLIGVFLGWLWRYLELPWRRMRFGPTKTAVVISLIAVICSAYLWKAAGWQNSIRALWGMELLDTADPLRLAGVATLTFAALFVLGRLFRLLVARLSRRFAGITPRPISRVLGVAVAGLLFWSIGQGLVLRWGLEAADASFKQADQLLDAEIPSPADPMMTGSNASAVSWDGLGAQGRSFIASGPRREAIGRFWQGEAQDPVRVYVGLNNADRAEARAALALQELQRQGAFERSVLVVIAPTGTGWIDPAAMDTLEFLHRGDVASVAVQYSYLTSWLSLLVEPQKGRDTASAMFEAVYGYWKTLPADTRPRLYLHGLSLGALNSQEATDLYDVIATPFDGALWSGPPFQSEMWRTVTNRRKAGSPAWLPSFRDDALVRFANQTKPVATGHWGPVRFVYLQYASDPVVFFEPSAFYTEPEWMKGQRGPDVSPQFRWLPVVTGLQLVFDMAIATTSPIGYGHLYAPQHYIDAWISLTEPAAVTPGDIERLKQQFIAEMAAIEGGSSQN